LAAWREAEARALVAASQASGPINLLMNQIEDTSLFAIAVCYDHPSWFVLTVQRMLDMKPTVPAG
jgi:hypothetical protein